MIISRVRRTIIDRQLVEKGMHLLVASSGGPDSTALLFVLARLAPELQYKLSVSSVNHGLRKAAVTEVEIVGRQAALLGLDFFPLRVTLKGKGSIQDQARIARYTALDKLSKQIDAQRIAVGHTQHDQAETVIMRLLRGSGLGGLSGIRPMREDRIIRPLIDCPRDQVHLFATQNYSDIVRDPSNKDPHYERVRIRETILPTLEKEDPAIVQHLCDIADDAQEQLMFITQTAQKLLKKALIGSNDLSTDVIRAADRAIRRSALRLWIHQHTNQDPGRAHLDQIDKALGGSGEIWLPQGWVVSIDKSCASCHRDMNQSSWSKDSE